MMKSATGFAGLTMPVFTAFGWTGEENAIKFALSQLESFIETLHVNLPRDAKTKLPSFGLSKESNSAYLAASSEVESDIHVAFNARPMSFEMQLIIKDKEALKKVLKRAESDLVQCHRLITELGPEWTLRVQQMEVNDETGESANYQDIYKDSVGTFDENAAKEVISKASYLNSENQWITPIYLGRRIPSEQVAAMGTQLIDVMSKEIAGLMPLISLLTGKVTRRTEKSKSKAKASVKLETAPASLAEHIVDPENGFVYVAELKPLHLRRGFINLTAAHWPFFAVNSRSTSREVTVYYNGIYDKQSSVWRLVPNDQARLMVSPAVHLWLEDYFSAGDQILLSAKRLDEDEIQVTLSATG